MRVRFTKQTLEERSTFSTRLREQAPQSRVLIVVFAQCCGRVKESELPVIQEHPFNPESPYAVSKAAADLLAYQYFCSVCMQVVHAGPSTHSPRRPSDYVCSGFAKQVAAIELGLQKPEISVGDLDLERDFTDVRDLAVAYEALTARGTSGNAHNIGRPIVLRRVLEIRPTLPPKTSAFAWMKTVLGPTK
jgi:GDP-4-dehydro-6-deoxy-D-mannose reductase